MWCTQDYRNNIYVGFYYIFFSCNKIVPCLVCDNLLSTFNMYLLKQETCPSQTHKVCNSKLFSSLTCWKKTCKHEKVRLFTLRKIVLTDHYEMWRCISWMFAVPLCLYNGFLMTLWWLLGKKDNLFNMMEHNFNMLILMLIT